MFENWPYSNFHDLNLDWILRTMREQVKIIQSKVEQINANTADIVDLKQQTAMLADQIESIIESGFSPSFAGDWDINTAYPKWSMVYVPAEGTSYMAKQDVPAGIPITNTDYWQLTADYNAQMQEIQDQLDALDAKVNAVYNTTGLPDVRPDLWIDPHLFVEQVQDGTRYRPQGAVIINQNGVDYLYALFFLNNASNDILAKIDMTTGNIVATVTNYNFTHGNSLAYSPITNTIYIAGAANTSNLYKVDASSMAYLGMLTLPHTVNMLSFWDGKLWCMEPITGHTLYSYDETDFTTVIDTIDIDPGDSLWNDMHIDDKYIYLSTLRDTDNGRGLDGVAVYYHTGAIKGWSILPTSIEIESLNEIDGEIYATFYTAGGMLGAYITPTETLKAINRFMRAKPRRIQTSLTNTRVYLDSTYTGNLCDGSSIHPFRNVSLMIQCSYYTGYSDLSIYITGSFDTVMQFEMGNAARTIRLLGNADNVSIGGFIGHNGNYILQDLIINDEPVPDNNQANINVYNSTVEITDCVLNTPNSVDGYGVYGNKSNISLTGVTFNTARGIFSNLGSHIRVGDDCVFNCSNNYYRIYQTGAIFLDGVSLAATTRIMENTNAEQNFGGTIYLVANDNFASARVPGQYIAPTGTIGRTISGVPPTESAFTIQVSQGLNKNNLIAEFYSAAMRARWINYFTLGAWTGWQQYTLTIPE